MYSIISTFLNALSRSRSGSSRSGFSTTTSRSTRTGALESNSILCTLPPPMISRNSDTMPSIDVGSGYFSILTLDLRNFCSTFFLPEIDKMLVDEG